jgi:hypothetical protein
MKRLQDQVSRRFHFVHHEEVSLDGLLVVCGCPTACPDQAQDAPPVSRFLVACEKDMDGALGWLKGIADRGGSS